MTKHFGYIGRVLVAAAVFHMFEFLHFDIQSSAQTSLWCACASCSSGGVCVSMWKSEEKEGEKQISKKRTPNLESCFVNEQRDFVNWEFLAKMS